MNRERALIVMCIVALTALAWIYLLRIDSGMSSMESMAQMGMTIQQSWTLREFLLTFAMWSVMMVGMMVPTAMPVVLLFARMRAERGGRSSSGAAAFFASGHIAVWIAFSLLAALAQLGLHRAELLSIGMSVTSSILSGVILIAAGIYQLSPAKAKCLTNCQSPLGFLVTRWREGNRGAIELGLRHGLYCLGCCWALMCVLFVVGVMNLAWVAALTAFVFLEKFGPGGARIARVGGAAMVMAGAVALFQ